MRVRNPSSPCPEVQGVPAAVAAEAVQGLPTFLVAQEERRVVEAHPVPAVILALEEQAATLVVPGLQVPEDIPVLVEPPALEEHPVLVATRAEPEATPVEEAASPVGLATLVLALEVPVQADTLDLGPVGPAQAVILELALEATGPAQVLGQALVGITANQEVDPVALAPVAMAAQVVLEVLLDMGVRVAPQDPEDQEALVFMARVVLEDQEDPEGQEGQEVQEALEGTARAVLEDPGSQEGPVAAVVRVVPEGRVDPVVMVGPKVQEGMVDTEDTEDLEGPADPRVQALQEVLAVIRVQEAMSHLDLEVREPHLVVQALT